MGAAGRLTAAEISETASALLKTENDCSVFVVETKKLEASLQKNKMITEILDHAPHLGLMNWYLSAGCIAQTVWNELHGFPPAAHIRDYDLVYFDDSDLSFEAENAHLKEGKKFFQDLEVSIDIKNEARVHLWYQDRFGYSISPYKSVEEAIASWPTTATSVGIKRDAKGRFVVYAPFGLDDLYAMIVRPNKRQITKEIYLEKVRRWIRLWPKLDVIPWD